MFYVQYCFRCVLIYQIFIQNTFVQRLTSLVNSFLYQKLAQPSSYCKCNLIYFREIQLLNDINCPICIQQQILALFSLFCDQQLTDFRHWWSFSTVVNKLPFIIHMFLSCQCYLSIRCAYKSKYSGTCPKKVFSKYSLMLVTDLKVYL